MTEVLQAPVHGASHFRHDYRKSSSHGDLPALDIPIAYAPRKQAHPPYLPARYETSHSPSETSSAPSSPQLSHASFSRQTSYSATPASTISLDTRPDLDDEEIQFPSYESSGYHAKAAVDLPPVVEESPAVQAAQSPKEDGIDLPSEVIDDQKAEHQPTRHVDYLAHDWKEEDIWSSWRYIVSRRKTISNSVRLENASWRTWVKAKNKLKTVSPEKLNWLKDCDVTWLYGPLQTDVKKPFGTATSPPPSRLSHSSSFIAKKPILKKKAASVAMLEKSISSHSLLKQAGALLRAQQSSPAHGRPGFRRGVSDFSVAAFSGSSVANTPAEYEGQNFHSRPSMTNSDLSASTECRHIHFNNEVEQVIAIESDDDDDDEDRETKKVEEEPEAEVIHSEDEDDDGGLMMKSTPGLANARFSNRSTPRGSFSNENKTIAPLPSTTLKYRSETPEPAQSQQLHGMTRPWLRGKNLSPSPSQETLRPTRPHHNFLLGHDEDEIDSQWGLSANGWSSTTSPYDDEDEPGPGMRRTESGMFMPYDENEPDGNHNRTIFGQALNTVNTLKDIAHVVWNVGWGK